MGVPREQLLQAPHTEAAAAAAAAAALTASLVYLTA